MIEENPELKMYQKPFCIDRDAWVDSCKESWL